MTVATKAQREWAAANAVPDISYVEDAPDAEAAATVEALEEAEDGFQENEVVIDPDFQAVLTAPEDTGDPQPEATEPEVTDDGTGTESTPVDAEPDGTETELTEPPAAEEVDSADSTTETTSPAADEQPAEVADEAPAKGRRRADTAPIPVVTTDPAKE